MTLICDVFKILRCTQDDSSLFKILQLRFRMTLMRHVERSETSKILRCTQDDGFCWLRFFTAFRMTWVRHVERSETSKILRLRLRMTLMCDVFKILRYTQDDTVFYSIKLAISEILILCCSIESLILIVTVSSSSVLC